MARQRKTRGTTAPQRPDALEGGTPATGPIPTQAQLHSQALAAALADGRQSEAALEIQRGVCRLLNAHAFAPLTELPLANGRRADVTAVSASGDIWIVEIKSSVADFQTDLKWPEYRDYCDQFFFAVAPDFPAALIPTDAGLMIADRYGGEIVRSGAIHRLASARRRALTLSFARIAALRLAGAVDPGLGTLSG